MEKNWSIPFCYSVNGEGLSCFFVGVLLNEAFAELDGCAKSGRLITSVKICGIVAILFIIAGSLVYSFKVFADDKRIVIILMICPLVLFYAIYSKYFEKALCFKPVYALGKISMSIFFWHAPLLLTIKYLRDDLGIISSMPMILQFFSFLVILIGISIISYFVFKKGVPLEYS